ncbi:TetR/AcrR family transcriptional regulator [Corynebacterium sp.]|uniref:TetR/AcrR family transcriptional regulator n=1 Tax=Corynebacterium sp. TaxID=1720 RepID=UPI00264730AA|nr:TetR/AcrR family transcriptional regulator [Corynebacterium sp.]MDN6137249.1 TetR/AcrR family transcriptional regulator [Corynebacterium sp.]MDN6737225.1 TetR/AcrR family transcriptional regulator [Corynebacterium sp.]
MTTAREKLLSAAEERFYNNGINATGIDSITPDAGVANKSLYNNFSSKAALVDAYIEQRHQEWLSLYRAREAQAASAMEKVLAVFDAYIDHAMYNYANGFRECGLLNAAAEFPAVSPVREAVKEHKQEVEAIIAHHLLAASTIEDSDHAQQVAEHLSFC